MKSRQPKEGSEFDEFIHFNDPVDGMWGITTLTAGAVAALPSRDFQSYGKPAT